MAGLCMGCNESPGSLKTVEGLGGGDLNECVGK